jgi:hypothetical protein
MSSAGADKPAVRKRIAQDAEGMYDDISAFFKHATRRSDAADCPLAAFEQAALSTRHRAQAAIIDMSRAGIVGPSSVRPLTLLAAASAPETIVP